MPKYRIIRIKESTYELINRDCLKEFYRYNPNFIGKKITQEFIINRLAKHYLGRIKPPINDA